MSDIPAKKTVEKQQRDDIRCDFCDEYQKGTLFTELAKANGEFTMSSYFVKSGILTAVHTHGEKFTLEVENERVDWHDEDRWNRRKLDLKIGDTVEIAGKVCDADTRSPSFKGKALYVATTGETYGVLVGVSAFVMLVSLTLLACFLALLSCTLILAPATVPALFLVLSGLRDFFVTRKCGRMLMKDADTVQKFAPAE